MVSLVLVVVLFFPSPFWFWFPARVSSGRGLGRSLSGFWDFSALPPSIRLLLVVLGVGVVPSILNVFFRLRYQSAGPTSTPWLASQTIYFLPIICLFYSSHPRISLVEEKYEIIWNAAAVTYYLISLPARNAGVRSCLVICVAGSHTLRKIAKRKN